MSCKYVENPFKNSIHCAVFFWLSTYQQICATSCTEIHEDYISLRSHIAALLRNYMKSFLFTEVVCSLSNLNMRQQLCDQYL